jgi:hypothetical protein
MFLSKNLTVCMGFRTRSLDTAPEFQEKLLTSGEAYIFGSADATKSAREALKARFVDDERLGPTRGSPRAPDQTKGADAADLIS